MNQNTWRIEDNGVRVFLLAGEDRALLIDSGMQLHNALDIRQIAHLTPGRAPEYTCRHGPYREQ